jgi:hypothetical protein
MIAAQAVIVSGDSTTVLADAVTTSYFGTEVAHYYIIGFALFSIAWGVANVFMVSALCLIVSRSREST